MRSNARDVRNRLTTACVESRVLRLSVPPSVIASKPCPPRSLQADCYREWISLVATFTIDSFKHWQWAANSVYYLLSLWSRLVASMPYLKGDVPSQLESYVPQVSSNGPRCPRRRGHCLPHEGRMAAVRPPRPLCPCGHVPRFSFRACGIPGDHRLHPFSHGARACAPEPIRCWR
eukprot:scaffold232893_cov30-Tisochrysis_lutea.AAC.3